MTTKKAKQLLLPHVQRVGVEKDDVVVVESPGRLTADEQQTIAQALHRIWPKNQVLVLQDGMRLKIGTYTPPSALTPSRAARRR